MSLFDEDARQVAAEDEGEQPPGAARLEQVRAVLNQLPLGMLTPVDQLVSVGVTEAEFAAVVRADMDAEVRDYYQRREDLIASQVKSMSPERARYLVDSDCEQREHAAGCNLDAAICPSCSPYEGGGFEDAEYELEAAHRVLADEVRLKSTGPDERHGE